MRISATDRRDRPDIARLSGIDETELDERDRLQRPIGRWIASDGAGPVGVATAFVRPDDRCFLVHRLADEAAFEPLLDAALDEVDRPIHLTVDRARPARRAAAEARGFTAELMGISFDVPFEPALALTGRIRRPGGAAIRPAVEMPTDTLFALDTELRQDVPGTDGWRGDREWFDAELASPEHDSSAYLVAVDRDGGEPLGLVRFWRNESGPDLGMLGVRRGHRTGSIAVALLDAGMRAATTWGFATFGVHTAHRSLHRRLQRLGASETGGFTRLVNTVHVVSDLP